MAASVWLIQDDRISRDRFHLVTRVVNALKSATQKEGIDWTLLPAETKEPEILAALKKKPPGLILVPWDKTSLITKLEGELGLNRAQGTIVAGYFSESVSVDKFPKEPTGGSSRLVLFDWVHMQAQEAALWVSTLVKNEAKGGLLPLLGESPIYTENWSGVAQMGPRLDALLKLPEVAAEPWASRTPELRLLFLGLWSLVFDEGPGRTSNQAKALKANFQFGAQNQVLALRLKYEMPGFGPKETLKAFWPNAKSKASGALSLLTQHSDFLRVHLIDGTSTLEVVVGLTPGKPSLMAAGKMRTLWIEPLNEKFLTEPKHLKLFQIAQSSSLGVPASTPNPVHDAEKMKKLLGDAADRMKQLKQMVSDRDQMIRELRSGGVGVSQALPMPDAEALLEAFQHRYSEAQFEIRKLELQISAAEKKGASPTVVQSLQSQVLEWTKKEEEWISKIEETIQTEKKRKQAPQS